MKSTTLSLALLMLAVPACSDDSPDQHDKLDGSVHQPDGSTLLDANLGDATRPDGSLPDASLPDASAYVAPANPSSFKLSLRQTQCFGTCPAFTVAIEQDGAVAFDGAFCSTKPGALTKQVATADARAVYDAFVSAGFWNLRDTYQSLSDGCTDLATDGSSTYWSAEVDGHVKTIARDDTCKAAAGVSALDTLETLIRSKSSVDSWIGDGSVCHGEQPMLAASYKLGSGSTALGVITFAGLPAVPGGWKLTDCAGTNTLASGGKLQEFGRVSLLGKDDKAITLPAGLGDVGSIVITKGSAGVSASGTRAGDDLPLTIVEASGC